MLGPADLSGRSYFEEVTRRVYERYQQLLTDSSALDFDDLLMKTVLLFRQNAEILGKYQARYMHIQVDEFQDTNLVQYELVKLLAGKYRNICVVGDPDQSIYSWRSADIRNILNFEKDFPDARVILLEQNYRSTQLILDAATHVISANRPRTCGRRTKRGSRLTLSRPTPRRKRRSGSLTKSTSWCGAGR
jgi:DNA helicase-2/ATP-dependent DNA helicase PcrA